MINNMTDKLSISEYVSLIRAGYTAEQIEAEYGEAGESRNEEQAPAEQPNEQPEEKEAEKPEERAPAADPYADLLAEIKLLRSDMQRSNIRNSSMDLPQQPTAESILATLLAPSKIEKGK